MPKIFPPAFLGAQAEAAAVAAVSQQLEQYAARMAQDHSSQRARVAAIFAAAVERGERFVDSILVLSNAAPLVSAYVIGGGGGAIGPSPVMARYASEVVQGADQQLRQALLEHRTWLAGNAERQAAYYTDYVARRLAAVRERAATRRTLTLEQVAAGAELPAASGHAENSDLAQRNGSGGEGPGPGSADDTTKPLVWRDGAWQPAADLDDALSRAEVSFGHPPLRHEVFVCDRFSACRSQR